MDFLLLCLRLSSLTLYLELDIIIGGLTFDINIILAAAENIGRQPARTLNS